MPEANEPDVVVAPPDPTPETPKKRGPGRPRKTTTKTTVETPPDPTPAADPEQAQHEADYAEFERQNAERRAAEREKLDDVPVPPKPVNVAAPAVDTDAEVLKQLAPKQAERHDCGLPMELITDRERLVKWVNDNEYRLDTTRRSINVGVPIVQRLYPIYKHTAKVGHVLPVPVHFFAAALILLASGVSTTEEEKIDSGKALDSLTA